jgi:hypothetical protein
MGTIFVDNLEPQSGTSLTLGASGDTIGLATGATAGFGKIGQVLQSVDTGVFLTSSSSFTDTNLSINITPSSTSSKILVSYEIVHSTSTATNIFYKLLRDTTAIGIGTNGSYSVLSTTASTIDASRGEGTSMSFLDSPSTSSQITFKVQAHAQGNNLYINRRANTDWNCISTLTVMEVLA